jgi:hypothetical protein
MENPPTKWANSKIPQLYPTTLMSTYLIMIQLETNDDRDNIYYRYLILSSTI